MLSSAAPARAAEVRMTPLGGAREFSGSAFVIEVWGTRLLIDAGGRSSPSAMRPGLHEFASLAGAPGGEIPDAEASDLFAALGDDRDAGREREKAAHLPVRVGDAGLEALAVERHDLREVGGSVR